MALPSFLSLSFLAGSVAAVTLSVASSGGNATSGYQYGLMFEDINHGGDGGMYVSPSSQGIPVPGYGSLVLTPLVTPN